MSAANLIDCEHALRRIGPRALTWLLVLLLGACASAPQRASTPQTNSGRYQMAQDSGALEYLDLSRVNDVVPRPELRTAAGNKSPYSVNGRTYHVLRDESGYSETGLASWYGRKFHGHLTSNGEVYDMFQVSAAHTSLPIPSYVRVTNLDNGKSILARVNDRGPFHQGRVIDMSYAGAVLLGYADRGTARVRVEAVLPGRDALPAPIPTPAPAVAVAPVIADNTVEALANERARIEQGEGQEYLQVGAFANLDSAQGLVARMQGMTPLEVFIHTDTASNGTVLHKVRVGPLLDEAQANQLVDNVKSARLGTPFRVRI
ncbi:MAG TPA: septal ring lytic transglycosylase RlpA family protein [Hyphomicrobiales bacterium]|nr:septal ring lytic transglycosylase RlpA family protein [Hyphomicrobiales bacterium]